MDENTQRYLCVLLKCTNFMPSCSCVVETSTSVRVIRVRTELHVKTNSIVITVNVFPDSAAGFARQVKANVCEKDNDSQEAIRGSRLITSFLKDR